MKFNLYHSALNDLSSQKLISDLKVRDKNQRHIIITPDKSSLYYERKLFALLDEQSFFDISTTTLSRFANSVVGKGYNILSKQGGVLIIKRILLENKSKLKSFGKSSELVGFAGSLFDTICMFKSCHILPNQIDKVNNETLNNKLQDIKLVYEKYEEYLKNDFTDSFNRLNLCASKISKEEFKDCNFYFVGFADFTKQGYEIIEKLIKCANSVSVATTFAKKNKEKNNANIYLNNVYYNCIDLCNIVGVECNKIEVKNFKDEEKKFLTNQLLSNKAEKYLGARKYVDVIKYNTIEDEIKNTCQNIKYNIINGNLKYKNFAIVVSDLNKYKQTLIDYLEKFDINYFMDENKKLKDTMFARFVSNIISILYRPTKFNVVKLLRSSILGLSGDLVDNYISFIDKYEPQFDNLLRFEDNDLQQYFDVILKFRKENHKQKISELLDVVERIFNELDIENRLDNLMKEYYLNNKLEEYRMLKQSYDKVVRIFEEIRVIGDYECTYQELNKFFDLFAENSSIVVPPIVTDAVFVTSIDCENLFDVDYVYFLGFNEGQAPKYSMDSGIITDDEINKMPLNARLNPTINVINKRLKFKLFELLFMANKKIFVSFYQKSNEGDAYPNAVINSLMIVYGDVFINGSNYLDLINNNIVSFNEENFVYNNFTKKVAIDNYVKLLKYWDNYNSNKNYIKTLSILNKIVSDSTYIYNLSFKNEINPINKGLFIANSKVGISQIERFNTCPYMHFADYGLKLKSSEKNDLSAIDVGNIIHEFVKVAVFKLSEDDIAHKILDEILKKDEYSYLVENERNNFIIKSLYGEVERVFNVLKYQQALSEFKTEKVEVPFSVKICKLGDKDIFLTGVIDRIDKFGNGIRVIDYKTGRVEFKNYNDIYYGNKIQVVVYLSALSNEKNLQPLGALYLPISNAFANDKSEELYQMQGVVDKNLSNLIAFDKNLSSNNYTSSLINLSTTSKGEFSLNTFYKNMCLSADEMQKLNGFVMDIVTNTIKKIEKHEINPHPIDENVCTYCAYKGLCNFSEKYFNQYKETVKIKNLDDLSGGEYE